MSTKGRRIQGTSPIERLLVATIPATVPESMACASRPAPTPASPAVMGPRRTLPANARDADGDGHADRWPPGGARDVAASQDRQGVTLTQTLSRRTDFE